MREAVMYDADRPGRWEFAVKLLFAAFAAVIFGIALAVLILILELTSAVPQWQGESEELLAELHAQNISLLQTQAAARETLQQIGEMRADALTAEVVLARILDNHLSDANTSLARTGYSISFAAGAIADSANQATSGAAQVESQLSSRLDDLTLFTDCDHNADCAFNRWVGMSRGIEQAAKAWGEAAPRQAQAATETLENGAALTGAVRKSWWARFLNLFH